ncbi:hypothetical protein GGS23DRAFT_596829 [Durotheca rogersii]|uniref:uncharacterized protein n=1 Tax=Durotheca rogersii TaxID=419775 RepID=UPI0022200B5B|nr:uncharacterized protein GGS23DRAFT_596829 [Durotheca rogersii]KAI5863060.1 hypothetical protein GGS23DRAFT_596829 [Durotheca rogersii]
MATQWTPVPFRYVTPGEVFAAGLVFPLVCIALVSGRLYVRRHKKQQLGPDDWTAVFAVFFLIGTGASLMTGERLGVMGYPMPVPDGTEASEAYSLFNAAYITIAKIEFAFQFLQCFQFAFVKSSAVFFFRRVFIGHRGTVFDWSSAVLLVIINLWSISFLMALIFGCGKNVALHWGPLQQLEASGCDGITPEKANLISDPILDFFILVFPIPSIWRLNMSLGKRIAVTGVFLVGTMTLAASVTRLAIHIIVLDMGYGAGYDPDQVVTTLYFWTQVECGLATIAINLPTMSFLLHDPKLWPRLTKGISWSNLVRPFSSRTRETVSSGGTGGRKHINMGQDNSFHPLEPLPSFGEGYHGSHPAKEHHYFVDVMEPGPNSSPA